MSPKQFPSGAKNKWSAWPTFRNACMQSFQGNCQHPDKTTPECSFRSCPRLGQEARSKYVDIEELLTTPSPDGFGVEEVLRGDRGSATQVIKARVIITEDRQWQWDDKYKKWRFWEKSSGEQDEAMRPSEDYTEKDLETLEGHLCACAHRTVD